MEEEEEEEDVNHHRQYMDRLYIQLHSTHLQYRNNPIDCNIGLRHKCIHCCCHWKEEEG